MILPASLDQLDRMIAFVREGAEKAGLEKRKVRQILVATEEPLMNSISYAYPDQSGNIEISFAWEEGRGFVIQLVDWGIPFDPLSLPMPDIDTPMEERKVGGLGIYMMRQIMDEVAYRREGDCNVLTLVKY